MQVEAVMTSPVIGIDPSASVADAARLMLSKGTSGLPVIGSDGALVGIISEGDFLRREELGTKRRRSRWLEFLVSPGKVAEEYVHANGRRVEQVMSPNVITTTRNASLSEAVDLMTKHGVKRLPVVDNGKVVGIVTRSDLLRALLGVLPVSCALPGDETIRQKILAELESQSWARGSMISVSVEKGVVDLSGSIFDEREREAAIVASENVDGVKEVRDNLYWVEPFSGMVIAPST